MTALCPERPSPGCQCHRGSRDLGPKAPEFVFGWATLPAVWPRTHPIFSGSGISQQSSGSYFVGPMYHSRETAEQMAGLFPHSESWEGPMECFTLCLLLPPPCTHIPLDWRGSEGHPELVMEPLDD